MPGALLLVIETSTANGSIALIGPDGVVEQHGFCSDRNHNALLFAPLQVLLDGAGHRDIGLVLVGSGPGSYSGTRVGIAAAQGVAIALGCPAVAVPSILALPSAQGGTACVAIGDARRGSYWSARVINGHLTAEPELCNAGELADIIAASVAAGINVISCEDPSRFPLPDELAGAVRLEIPDATRLWQAWFNSGDETRRAWAATIPQPIYLKPPHITPATPRNWQVGI